MYLFAGGNPFALEPFETASVRRYDPILNTWNVLGPLNVGRAFPASTIVGGMALVAGGFTQYESTDITETSGESARRRRHLRRHLHHLRLRTAAATCSATPASRRAPLAPG